MATVYFSGEIDHIIFENPSNFFKILRITIDDTDSDYDDFEIIITGTFAELNEGDSYTFWGELTQHPKYGQQLKVTRYERHKPTTSGLIQYFSSKHFKGIGKKTAEKIIALYGDNTIDRILTHPDKLTTISGLSAANREAFVATLRRNYGTEQIFAKLAEYGIINQTAVQIFERYKEATLDKITENPYQLVEDIPGIGFKLADQLAETLGIDSQSPQRFKAALRHCLLDISFERGDTYVEAKTLLEQTLDLLEESRPIELDPAAVAEQLTDLIDSGKVQHIGTKIFDNSLFQAESGIQKQLTRLLKEPLAKPFSDQLIATEIATLEEKLGLTYDPVQKAAITKALQSKLFLLTGGPGTGKTTIINAIIATYNQLHSRDKTQTEHPILLAAPTGRAARRMGELTGLPAATIHRHLGLNGDRDYQSLDDYLDCDLIIIDEFSMVDTWLANLLFSAIASHTQVIIVGDSDQLPSVGPGQVLSDLLQIPELPQLTLSKIFRQSEDSTIISLASHMRQGQLPADFTHKKADRSYFEAQAQHIPAMVERIVQAALKTGIAPQDIQILAPMYRGQAGITTLNHLMQELLNPLSDALEFTYNELVFRINDRVLHLVNDSERNVFNGDIGYIIDLTPAKYSDSKQDELTIQFDGNDVSYPRSDWHKITLAYAMSIHKSQGSEFPVVILPITRQSGRLLQRNLIYTAITRVKSKLVMLGELQAFDYAVKHQGSSRKTYLIERFLEKSDTPKFSTNQPDELVPATIAKTNSKPPHNSQQDTNQEPVNEQKAQLSTTYRLTADNWQTIDPMIGLTLADIEAFFGKKNPHTDL